MMAEMIVVVNNAEVKVEVDRLALLVPVGSDHLLQS
jgi:hypothetical protein